MNKNLIKILVSVISFVIIIFLFVNTKNKNIDTISYKGETYVLLEYNMDIFTYNHNSNVYYEEDIIHPVFHKKWNVVYFNGDLFVLNKQVKKATKYYSNDNNYNWYIVFDNEDKTIKKSISISKDELLNLYNMDTAKRNDTITFEDIDVFGDVLKVSKDGLVQAVMNLVQVDNVWYYKTEIMTDDDREYVIKITDSLNDKINNLMYK